MDGIVGHCTEAMNLDDEGETPLSLQTMPPDVLHNILLFVPDVPDLLSCERTCRALCSALSDVDGGGEAVWRSLLLSKKRDAVVIKKSMFLGRPGAGAMTNDKFLKLADADPRFKTNKEIACVRHNLERIQAVQLCNKVSNVFVDKMGVKKWVRFVSNAFNKLGFRKNLQAYTSYPEITPGLRCTLRLRGDSSAVLSELVHQDMIDLIEGANLILAEEMGDDRGRSDGDAYPCLFARHLRVAYQLGGTEKKHKCWRTLDAPLFGPVGALTYAQCSRKLLRDEFIETAESVLYSEERDRVIRGLALKAGVVKLHADAFRIMWIILVHKTVALLEIPCRELFSLGRTVINVKRLLESNQSMWDTPPYPRTEMVEFWKHDDVVTVYTPAPRQLEEAARSLGMRVNKVYTHGWHVPEGSSPEEEFQAAALEYANDEHRDVCMTDGDYVESQGSDDKSSDHYLSSDYSSCDDPSSDFDSDEDF